MKKSANVAYFFYSSTKQVIKMSDEEFNDYNIQLSDDEHIWLCSEGI